VIIVNSRSHSLAQANQIPTPDDDVMSLPIKPGFPPMEAQLVNELPTGDNWQYEPKWDGFRCIAFRDGEAVELQSKSGQSLGRYFPEIVAAVAKVKATRFVIDGELIITPGGQPCGEAVERNAGALRSV
jgi:ATP-dependent DNA ligase